ncbi:hypothetical protein DPMN_099914 [Dreissena polymorpha]|uniref:Uncharacterized protein n=1 Tax=Dreissena polymorpha TaxID=45954 RepID=A0A9D4R7P4_DREPO|nr:hypothetical protein DPMN_099914 [Dreissena polymorpha]
MLKFWDGRTDRLTDSSTAICNPTRGTKNAQSCSPEITRYYRDKFSDPFHEDRKINVAFRVLTRKNAPPSGSHFHEDWRVNVASRVLTRLYYSHIRKNTVHLGSHVFQANIIIFEIIQDIIETNFLTKFHEDWTINVASREKCPALGGHAFKATKTIFELIQDIIGTNLLTKFPDDRKINVTSRVLTRKNAPPPWLPYIIGMNLLTKFHEDQTINVASRVKNAPPLGSHVFQANETIFKLIQDIIETNLQTKFHEDWIINVASRELTRQMLTPHNAQKAITKTTMEYPYARKCMNEMEDHEARKCMKEMEYHKAKIARTNCAQKDRHGLTHGQTKRSHVIQLTGTIFELNSRIKETNVLSKFHENWAKNVTSTRKMPRPLAACFSPIPTIFKLVQDINKTNVLTNFHDDWAKIVTSRVFTRKTAPPTGGHVFQHTGTTFELNQDIIKTNILTNFELGRDLIGAKLLTKFHEDGTRNEEMFTDGQTYNGQRPVRKAHLSNQVKLLGQTHTYIDRQTDRQAKNNIPPII